MRTTVRLDPELLRKTKEAAARSGRTMTAIIEDALRAALSRHRARPRRPVALPVEGGRGLLPGVDLDHGAALLDRMEGLDGSR